MKWTLQTSFLNGIVLLCFKQTILKLWNKLFKEIAQRSTLHTLPIIFSLTLKYKVSYLEITK